MKSPVRFIMRGLAEGKWDEKGSQASHPPLEGGGRLTWSAAKCEGGGGGAQTGGRGKGGGGGGGPKTEHNASPPHPAAHFIRVDPPPPGEGNAEPRSPH